MRSRHLSLLVLPALCSVGSVLAAPSPALPNQQPLRTATPTPSSRWRSFAERVVEAIWPPNQSIDTAIPPTPSKQDHQAPAHTTARFGGDVVLRFNISTAEEAKSMAEAADTLLLDVWEFTKNWVDVRLSKDLVPSLLGLLPASLQHAHTPLLLERELVQAIYDTYPIPRGQQSPSPLAAPLHLHDRPFTPALRPHGADTNIFFSDYQPLSVIQPWLRLLASLFTTHVRLISIGQSYQGREIPALRVGVHPTNSDDPSPPKRKTVVVAGGLHAREWIGTSTVNYVAYNLVTAYGKNPRVTRLLEDFDIVFLPTLNPDGYAYTWETDRLWRKNRQATSVRFCPGIDLDRGFGYQWHGAAAATTTTAGGNPCSEAFAGDEPFAAIEAKRLAEWARNETENNNVEFVGFLDLHSYSQEILYPYSFTCEFEAPGQENLEELALGLEKTIRVSSGQLYEVMPACEGNVAASSGGDTGPPTLLPRIETAGGSALDWFYHEMRIRYAYQIKLRDRGTYGFLLPRENIVPTGEEIWDAFLYFAGFLTDVYVAEEARGSPEVEMLAPDLGFEDVIPGEERAEEGEGADVVVEFLPADPRREQESGEELEPWVIVEDLPGGEAEWELRRRRRR